jgi:ABC-type transport system involved in multi-copper enzyme maturation permease subunit
VTVIKKIWRVLEDLQTRMLTKLVLSGLALVAVIVIFGSIWSQATEARTRFDAVVAVLREADAVSENAVATRLMETGEIEVGGEVYGGPNVKAGIAAFFDEETGGLMEIAQLGALFVAESIPNWMPSLLIDRPDFIMWAAIVVLMWLLMVIWTEITVPVALTILGTMAIAAIPWMRGYTGVVVSVIGVGLLVITFVLLIRLLLLILGGFASPRSSSSRHGQPTVIVSIAAVAHTLIRESIRLRISLAFIVLMLVTLPLIPLWIDSEEPVRYQLQNFLSDSMSLVYTLAACMTLVLACATVSFEVRDRQIWHLITKPMGRLEYMLGKWVGLVSLNLILLIIGGISIFSFTQYLGTRADDPQQAIEVHDEVLTARVGVLPTFDRLTEDEVREKATTEYDGDAILRSEVDAGERTYADTIRAIVRRLRKEHLDTQRMVSPGGFTEGKEFDARVFEFHGLGPAKEGGQNLTLRYQFHIGRSEPTDRYPILFRFPSSGEQVSQDFVPEQWHRLLVPAGLIDEDGILRIQILNGGFSFSPSDATERFFANGATLFFDPTDLEVLWQAASFEANFARAMVVNWTKLAFLAMLGVSTATFLSFPIAVLLSFAVFIGGSMTSFIANSVMLFRPDADAILPIQIVQIGVAWIASSVAFLLEPFGRASPNTMVIEGRLVAWSGVLRDLLVIGLLWSGLVLSVGWAIFRRRELATYSGHG